MTIKALDLQVMLPRTQEVGRIQQVEQSNEQAQQQSFAAQLSREAELAQRSVQNLPQTREGRIKERERGNEGSNADSQKESGQETSPDKENRPEQSKGNATLVAGRLIDLKI